MTLYNKNEGKSSTMLHCWNKLNGEIKWRDIVNTAKTATLKGLKLMIQAVGLEEGLH